MSFHEKQPGNQLSLSFGPPPRDQIQRVMTWLDDSHCMEQPFTIRNLIDRLPDSLPDLYESLVIRILAVLVSEGKVRFLSHDEPMSISAAKYVLETPIRWKTIAVRPRTRLAIQQIEAVRRILSPHMELPASDNPDDLSDAIRQKMLHWRIEFQEFSRLCDKNHYPGKSDIQECLKQIRDLEQTSGADEILVKIQAGQTGILLDRIKTLNIFFGVGIVFWNALQKTMTRVLTNLETVINLEWFHTDWAELVLLKNRPDPWNVMDRIRELNTRISDEIDRIEFARIDESKKTAIEQVEGMIGELSELFQENSVSPEIRHNALFPLQQIKKNLLNASTHSDIDRLMVQAEDQYALHA